MINRLCKLIFSKAISRAVFFAIDLLKSNRPTLSLYKSTNSKISHKTFLIEKIVSFMSFMFHVGVSSAKNEKSREKKIHSRKF